MTSAFFENEIPFFLIFFTDDDRIYFRLYKLVCFFLVGGSVGWGRKFIKKEKVLKSRRTGRKKIKIKKHRKKTAKRKQTAVDGVMPSGSEKKKIKTRCADGGGRWVRWAHRAGCSKSTLKKKWPVSTVLLIFLCVLNRDLKDNSIGDLFKKKEFKFGASISFFFLREKENRKNFIVFR